MTVEELEIIVSAKIEQVKPQIQKVVREIKSAVKDTEGLGTELLGKIDTAKVANDIQKVKKQVKEAFNPNDTSGMKIYGQNIIRGVNQSLKLLKGQKVDLGNAVELSNYQNKLKQIKNTAQKTKEAVSKVGFVKYNPTEIQKVVDNYKKVEKEAEKTKEQVKKSTSNGNKLSNAIQQVKKHLSGAGNGTRAISNGLNRARSMASNVTSHLKVGLGQILKIAGSLIGLRAIYSGLRSVASSWLSSQNVQAQQLNTNIEYMKYALGSSLQPVIETIVNLIYQALKGVQSLIYALTGVNIFANASAKAYASMAKSANSASKATEALNGADIDEVHNIQENADSSGTGSSGGGITPNFDLSGIETASWLQKLIDNIKNGNWYEIGATIGSKINETLEKIPWAEIKETAGQIGKNIGQFINGGVQNTNWELVGGTVAEGVNTVFSFLKNFLETTDFKSLGESVSKTINGFFDKADWDTVGQTLSDGVTGALEFMLGVADTFDINKVYNAIGKIISNIDWLKILELLGKVIKTNFEKFTLLGQLDTLAKNLGGKIIASLKEGLLNKKEVITKTWDKVKGWFSDITKEAKVQIKQKWSDIKVKWNNLTVNIKNKTVEMKAKVATKWKDIKDKWKNATDNVKNKTAEMKAKVATKWKDIKQKWYNITGNIQDKTAKMKAKVGTRWNDIKQAWEGLLGNFKDKTIKIKAKITPIIDKIKEWLNTHFIDKVNSHIPSWIGQIPRLAKGNVAYEPLIAQFGEYSGARTNPEITTPQNIMRETFEGVLSKYATSNNGNISVENKLIVNGKEIARQILDDLNDEARRRGYKPILQH